MRGHGHVTPNPDGLKARCGGPKICRDCMAEASRMRTIKQQCWSCTEDVGNGYRLDLFLMDGDREFGGPFVRAPLCYPCFSTLARAMGEQGTGALRRRPAASAGEGGTG